MDSGMPLERTDCWKVCRNWLYLGLKPLLKQKRLIDMMPTSDLIRPILESPNFRALLDEMENLWEEEQQKRQEFYDRITPEDKWEFINGEIIMHSPAKKWKFPAPDLVVEVLSKDSITRDRQIKYRDYALHGIEEYWIIDPDALTVEQYHLDAAAQGYELFAKKVVGDYVECGVIPGFRAPVNAIFNEKDNLATLREFLKA